MNKQPPDCMPGGCFTEVVQLEPAEELKPVAPHLCQG
jgi:hypothetical protein